MSSIWSQDNIYWITELYTFENYRSVVDGHVERRRLVTVEEEVAAAAGVSMFEAETVAIGRLSCRASPFRIAGFPWWTWWCCGSWRSSSGIWSGYLEVEMGEERGDVFNWVEPSFIGAIWGRSGDLEEDDKRVRWPGTVGIVWGKGDCCLTGGG